MNTSPIIKPTKDLVEAVKVKTDGLPADPATIAAITAIKQKATSPGWDQDTDSLEALAEAIGAIGPTAGTTDSGVIVEVGDTGVPSVISFNSSGTANAFGSWHTVDPSISADSYICSLVYSPNHAYWGGICVEVGVGAAGSESTIIRFSYWCYNCCSSFVFPVIVPIKVAAGTRIAIRVSDYLASAKPHKLSIQYYQGL